MANIKLIDSGWGSKLRSGTQFAVRMNAGGAIDIRTESIAFSRGSGIEADPEPGTASTTAQRISSENETLSVSLRLRKDDSDDRSTFQKLFGIHQSTTAPGIDRTDGVKILYVDSTSDIRKTIVETSGATATEFHGSGRELADGTPCYIGFIKNLRAEDTPAGNMWKVRFEMVTT